MHNTSSRINCLRKKIIEKKIDALLVSKAANRFYLTGWLADSESGYLLITPKQAFVITDNRYTEEVIKKDVGFELEEYGQDDDFWKKLFQKAKLSKIGVEGTDLSLAELKRLRKSTKAKFVLQDSLVENL